jgi:hypothetical protein
VNLYVGVQVAAFDNLIGAPIPLVTSNALRLTLH